MLSTKKVIKPLAISSFLRHFAKDDNWHEVNAKTGNLGYGWIHYSFIRQLKPQRVLCIGSRYGFIPAVCAMACRDNGVGMVDFVDAGFDQNDPVDESRHWGGIGFWKNNNFKKHFGKFDLNPHLKVHVMLSSKFRKTFPKRKWSYAHIDGDHSYKGAKQDFKRFWPSLKPGGMLSFHDIYTDLGDKNFKYGVNKFWNELKEDGYNIMEFSGTCGLGVVQKNNEKI